MMPPKNRGRFPFLMLYQSFAPIGDEGAPDAFKRQKFNSLREGSIKGDVYGARHRRLILGVKNAAPARMSPFDHSWKIKDQAIVPLRRGPPCFDFLIEDAV